jgi:carbon-monoxide dehydrogenase large subunit
MAYLLERLVDEAARVSGRDRIALRRQNLISPADMPYRSAAGALYGVCEFEKNLDEALELAGWPTFSERQEAAQRAGRLRGIGVSVYVESTGGAPSEFSEVRVSGDGYVEARMGTQSFGMGHETVFAQVLADQLGIDMSAVRVVDGDTDKVRQGAGSHGSRSMRIGGGALVKASQSMLNNAMAIAAEYLEAARADIEYRDGAFAIAGTDRSVPLFELGAFAETRHGESLHGDAVFDTTNNAYANGCHICEVEIDPDTGAVTLVNHVLVTDVGRVINPLITDGQLHGGIAQGIGQSVTEQVAYDTTDGQLLSGSFMDYCLPRADDLPDFLTSYNELHCDDNPLGAKGAGEGPTTGCPPAVLNAIAHALEAVGVMSFDMPATPQRVWSAIQASASVDGNTAPAKDRTR